MTAGMIVAGIGKALMKSYAMAYTVRSGREAFLFSRDEVGRKIPLVNYFSFGIGATVIPLTSSGFFKGFGYRTTLDKLGVVYGINAVALTVPTAKKN